MVSVLGFGALLMTPGCLVPEVPEYTPPQRTPPFIVPSSVTPSPYHLLHIDQNQVVQTLNFDVRSEDAGEPLVGSLRWDYLAGGRHISDQTYAPSTFDVERQLSFSFQPRYDVPVGCHVLTLFLMHDSSYDDELDLPRNDAAWSDVAIITWIMHVASADGDGEPRVSECPLQGTPGVGNGGGNP